MKSVSSRGNYTSPEPNLMSLHPEDEERENHCVLGHGVMPQHPLHLHQAVGPWAEGGCASAWLMKSPWQTFPPWALFRHPALVGANGDLGRQPLCKLCEMKSCGLHTFWLLKISLHLPCTLHPHLPSILFLFIVLRSLRLDAGFPLSCDESAWVRGWNPKWGLIASPSRDPCFQQWGQDPSVASGSVMLDLFSSHLWCTSQTGIMLLGGGQFGVMVHDLC